MRIGIIILNIFLITLNTSVQNAAFAQKSSNNVSSQRQKEKNKKALFVRHFKILDSVVNLYPSDTVYVGGCFQSILFMVKNTKIEVTTDVSGIIGRTKFNKGDWLNWHEWYRKKYGNKDK